MRFPFGRPSSRRPPRGPAEGADLFLLGVYPSALHIRWTLPDERTVVGALAVDDEPEVFWDGTGADRMIADWQHAIGWTNRWGQVGAAARPRRAWSTGRSGRSARPS